jgi:acyl carrier protein phosphodiesterase
MNFLAHIYLSGNNDFIKIGNFMADTIRGNQYENYPLMIQKGIILHRAIDTFTDVHPVFRQSTKRLHANYHHYSGVIVDVFYDHFLAKNWASYSDENLEDYVQNFYNSMLENRAILSEKAQQILPYMIEQNWLVSYKTIDGIERILAQMDKRIKYDSKMHLSVTELKDFYTEFEMEFTQFFQELQAFSSQKLIEL